MKWWFIGALIAVFAGLSLNEVVEDQVGFRRPHENRRLSNKTANIIQAITKTTAAGSKKIGDITGAIINPIFPTAGEKIGNVGHKVSRVIETVGNSSSNFANKSIEIVEDTAQKIIDIAFTEDEIKSLQNKFSQRLGIHQYRELDASTFRDLFKDLFNSTDVRTSDKTFCGLCKLLIIKIQIFGLRISKVAELICSIYYLLNTLSFTGFCKKVIDLNMPVLEYVVNNSKTLDPELICTILLQTRECNYPKPALSWTTAMPLTKPVYPPKNTNPSGKVLKILHLSDPHISLDYEPNGVVDCGLPLCCKKGLGNKLKGQNAGYWGDYDCDIPPWLYGNALQHISHVHKDLACIYLTGDIVDHTVWNTSTKSNTEIINLAYRALKETFPTTAVFPVIGNHETTPLNAFAPNKEDIIAKGLSTKWLYELMAKIWSQWLPERSLKTVRRQGYYAYSVNKKLKIIGLNNNVAYNLNWWLLLETNFLNEQLQFLVKELEESEKNGQFVHILAHVPLGNQECIEPWEVSYNEIVRRYSHIIKGQFVGHTHTDELKIFYDKDKKPINMAFNGASLTPYVKFNPNYKIVLVDADTMDVLDIVTYYFNLTEANLHPNRSPAWKKLYSMKEAYDLPDLSPKSFDVLANNLFTNDTLMDMYWKNHIRYGDAGLKEGCDDACLNDIRCKLVTTLSLHPEKHQCYK